MGALREELVRERRRRSRAASACTEAAAQASAAEDRATRAEGEARRALDDARREAEARREIEAVAEARRVEALSRERSARSGAERRGRAAAELARAARNRVRGIEGDLDDASAAATLEARSRALERARAEVRKLAKELAALGREANEIMAWGEELAGQTAALDAGLDRREPWEAAGSPATAAAATPACLRAGATGSTPLPSQASMEVAPEPERALAASRAMDAVLPRYRAEASALRARGALLEEQAQRAEARAARARTAEAATRRRAETLAARLADREQRLAALERTSAEREDALQRALREREREARRAADAASAAAARARARELEARGLASRLREALAVNEAQRATVEELERQAHGAAADVSAVLRLVAGGEGDDAADAASREAAHAEAGHEAADHPDGALDLDELELLHGKDPYHDDLEELYEDDAHDDLLRGHARNAAAYDDDGEDALAAYGPRARTALRASAVRASGRHGVDPLEDALRGLVFDDDLDALDLLASLERDAHDETARAHTAARPTQAAKARAPAAAADARGPAAPGASPSAKVPSLGPVGSAAKARPSDAYDDEQGYLRSARGEEAHSARSVRRSASAAPAVSADGGHATSVEPRDHVERVLEGVLAEL